MNQQQLPPYRLGIDLGTNSIGWAAVRLNGSGNPVGILDMGVRIFPDGRDEQSEESNAKERRRARGARRRRDRYLKRRHELMDALVEYGLMPQGVREREALEKLDPYDLRGRALDDSLEPCELGRALFHLNQRRGFKSNRKTATEEGGDGKSLAASMDNLRAEMARTGSRTLGALLADRHTRTERVRFTNDLGLYPARRMYEEEFDAIREKQQPHQSLSDEQWEKLRANIFDQRPLKDVVPGWCQFEEGERRARRALPIFQEFRIVQEVNNLRVREPGMADREFLPEERERALARLRSGLDITLTEKGEAKKNPTGLGLPSGATLNLAANQRSKIAGDETTKRMTKTKARKGEKAQVIFGKRWAAKPLDERNEIVRYLLDTENPEEVAARAQQEWGLDQTAAHAFGNVVLPPGYGSLSEKAIRKILPHLQEGKNFADAVKSVKDYKHHSDFRNDEAHDYLPPFAEALPRDVVNGRFPNPTVNIGLNQLRLVVNALIDAYGKPQDIVVELARELKWSRQQKIERRNQDRVNEKLRKDWAEKLEEQGKSLTPHLYRKLRLWHEQKTNGTSKCPYTGDTIGWDMVRKDRTEIDHILPLSRTLDDSPANKILVLREPNRDKGSRSPAEWRPSGWQDMKDRAPRSKQWRFEPDAMKRFEESDHWLERQLNETQYLSRVARTYLAYLYDEKGEGRVRVRAIPGRMTDALRSGWWGKKQRDDHRHHAIDAFVVACTTQGLLQQFANQSKRPGAYRDADRAFHDLAKNNKPWDGFNREDLRQFRDRIVVSYKPDRPTPGNGITTGKLHKGTAFGIISTDEKTGTSELVTRKQLNDARPPIKRADLERVRDETMRAALLTLWDQAQAESGENAEKRARFIERAANPGVLINGKRQPVRRVRVTSKETVIPIKDKDGKTYKGYVPGGNEFAEVWRMPDGSWQTVVARTFDVNQPGFSPESLRPHPAAKRLAQLRINDMGAFGTGDERRIVRVRKITNLSSGEVEIYMDDHNESNVDARVTQSRKDRKEGKPYETISAKRYTARQLKQQGFRKVSVGPIGRVRDPGPRSS